MPPLHQAPKGWRCSTFQAPRPVINWQGPLVLRQMLDEFPDHRDRGVKSADFAVLRLTRMPAILVEAEFLSNPKQLEFLADTEHQKRMARAIARGVPANL